MKQNDNYSNILKNSFNFYDLVVLVIFTSIIILLAKGWMDMHSYFDLNHTAKVSLDLANLPYYVLRSFMRLIIGLVLSFIFALVFGTLAAKCQLRAKFSD